MLRAFLLAVSLVAVLPAGSAVAQSEPAAGSRSHGGDITRDQYLEQARQRAEKRFDRMDTDHNGVLTLEERRAARAVRASKRHASAPPQ